MYMCVYIQHAYYISYKIALMREFSVISFLMTSGTFQPEWHLSSCCEHYSRRTAVFKVLQLCQHPLGSAKYIRAIRKIYNNAVTRREFWIMYGKLCNTIRETHQCAISSCKLVIFVISIIVHIQLSRVPVFVRGNASLLTNHKSLTSYPSFPSSQSRRSSDYRERIVQ